MQKYESIDFLKNFQIKEEQKPLEASFKDRIRQEFLQGSAIALTQYEAAVKIIEDSGRWEPHEALGHQVNRFWLRHKPHSFGEIATLILEDGRIWQAKPQNPRIDWSKTRKQLKKLGWHGDEMKGIAQYPQAVRYQKYEFPKGRGSSPYLPPVPLKIRQLISDRYSCTVPAEGSFWDWVASRPDLPITFTEGGKKALSLLSQGYLAISLIGVNGGYRSRDALGNKITPHLISGLERFCQEGRPILLAFDQDTKASTRRQVTGALLRFGSLLSQRGCQVRIAQWKGSQGKGVDDLIAGAGAEAWKQVEQQAFTLEEFHLWLALEGRLGGITPDLRVNIADLAAVSPESIPQTGIIAIGSAKGTSKTKLIGSLTLSVGETKALLLGHRIALVRNLCGRLGIDYRGDLDKAQGRYISGSGYALRMGGVVDGTLLAVNPSDFAGCDLILDEVVQVLRHLLTSSTCNKDGKRPVLLARFAELVRVARRVILADADLDKATIDYVQALRGDGKRPWLLVNDAKLQPWPVEFIEAPDASIIIAKLLEAIAAGQRVFVATDSKAGSKWLEDLISRSEKVGGRCLILNSETSGGEIERAVIEQPEEVRNFSVVIATPSLGTGWSEESNHFDAVFGLFWGVSSTDVDMAQALARVRQPVARVVWCAKKGRNFSRIGRDTNPLTLKKLLADKTNATAQLSAASLGALGETLNGVDYNSPHVNLWSQIEASRNRSMWSLRSALKVRLIHEGHQLTILQHKSDEAAKKLLKAARDAIAIREADAIANAPDLTAAEAHALQNCEKLPPDERLALEKWRLAQFYCLPSSEITPDLVIEDKNGRRRSQLAALEQFLTPELAAEADSKAIERQAQWGEGLMPWDVPHAELRRRTRELLGLGDFLQSDLSWTSENMAGFKQKVLAMAPQVKAALNCTVRPEMSSAQILGILLNQLGLKTKGQQYREAGRRIRRYQLDQQALNSAIAVLKRRAQTRQESTPRPVTHPPVIDNYQGVSDRLEAPEMKESPRTLPNPPSLEQGAVVWCAKIGIEAAIASINWGNATIVTTDGRRFIASLNRTGGDRMTLPD